MSKLITKEIAEQFLADHDSVDLNGFTSITEAAAESLSNYEDTLYLNGLTEISEEVATSLSKHRGKNLVLNGLTEISDEVAEALSKHEKALSLAGLTSLTDAATEALSNKAGMLHIRNISRNSLTEAAAESLTGHNIFTADDVVQGRRSMEQFAKALDKIPTEYKPEGLTITSEEALELLTNREDKVSANTAKGGCLSLIVIGLTASFLLGRAITALVN